MDGLTQHVPSSAVEPASTHTIMRNLWYNNGRWFALVDEGHFVKNIKMSRNQEITCLHVKNATEWMQVSSASSACRKWISQLHIQS